MKDKILLYISSVCFVLGILLITGIIIGCRPPAAKITDNGSLNVTQLKIVLKDKLGIEYDRVFCIDSTYKIVDTNWLQKKALISAEFDAYLRYINLTSHRGEVNDCDKFSRAFIENCARFWRDSDFIHALAIGMVSYITKMNDQYESHQINVIIAKNNEVLFYEPQLKKYITLNADELKTAKFNF